MVCSVCGSNDYFLKKSLFDDRYGAPGKFDVVFCKHCSFGKTIPSLKDTEIPTFYSKYYPLKEMSPENVKDSVDNSSSFKKWLLGVDNIAHQYANGVGKKVLDIGSASGVSLLDIRNNGLIPFGIEPDSNAQEIARKLGLNVFKGFITDNPFLGIKFDYITASQTIEHTTSPGLFLAEGAKRLKRDGLFIVSFPNTHSIYKKLFGRWWINWHIPYHQNHFSLKSFSILAQQNGLIIKRYKTITPSLWTAAQVVNYIWKPKYNVINNFWRNKKGQKLNLKVILMELVFRTVFVFSIPINRLIDFLGCGDSMLLFMSKKI